MSRRVISTSTGLDKETTICLKGVLAVMVLISHLHGRVDLFDSSILGTMFSAFGYLAVSVFFFLSGYGLEKSNCIKTNYIAELPRKRIFPFYCLCCLMILIYIMRDILFGNSISGVAIIQSFVFGQTVVDNGWYLQAQLVFYIIFYLCYRYGNSKKKLLLILGITMYCLFCVVIGLSTTWYEASYCFVLGVLFAENENKSSNLCNAIKTPCIYYLFYTAMFGLFLVALYFGNKSILPETGRIAIKLISALLFSVLAVSALSLIEIRNCVTRFLGNISLEIYLLQGIFLDLFMETIPVLNEWFYMLIVTMSTIVSAIIFNPVFKKIINIGR